MSKTDEMKANGYILANKAILKECGANAALILGELCAEHDYWEKRNALNEGYFFSTVENVENATGIGRNGQKKALDILQEHGYLQINYVGMPRKRFIKLISKTNSPSEHQSCVLVSTDSACKKAPTVPTSKHQRCLQVSTNGALNNNNIIYNKNNNIYKRGARHLIETIDDAADIERIFTS